MLYFLSNHPTQLPEGFNLGIWIAIKTDNISGHDSLTDANPDLFSGRFDHWDSSISQKLRTICEFVVKLFEEDVRVIGGKTQFGNSLPFIATGGVDIILQELFGFLFQIDWLTQKFHQFLLVQLRLTWSKQGFHLLYLIVLNGKPVIEVTNGLGAKICLFCQPDPRYEVNSQHNLSVILKNHFFSWNLFFSVLDENIFYQEIYSLLDLLLGQLEDIFHLRLQFEADLL